MVLGADAGTKLARLRGLDVLFLLRDDDAGVWGVGIGRLFFNEPAEIAPVEGS